MAQRSSIVASTDMIQSSTFMDETVARICYSGVRLSSSGAGEDHPFRRVSIDSPSSHSKRPHRVSSLSFPRGRGNEGHILEEEGRDQRNQREDQDRNKAVLQCSR